MSLTLKLILAFAGVLTAGFTFVGFVAAKASGDVVERDLERRIELTLGSVAKNPRFFIFEAPLRREELRQLADISGFEIVVPRPEGRLGSSLDADAAARFLAGDPGGRRFLTTLDGVHYRGARAEVAGGMLYLLCPSEPIERAKREARRPILLVSALGLLAAILIGALLAGTVTRPLRRLAERAAEVREGSLSVEIPRGGGREVRRLSRAFEEMLAGLSSYRERLVREEKMATLGRFSAAVAHELRNPLSSMRMTLEMLRGRVDEEGREEIDLVVTEMARLDHSVEELLFHAGEPRYVMEDFDIREAVSEPARILGSLAEHLDVRLQVEVPGEPLVVTGDRRRLRQAVMNLTLNAIHASDAGGSVYLHIVPEAGNSRIVVEDEGPGAPEELRDRLFEPFVSGREGGTGLGLAVTKAIASAHGATLAYERVGGRTRFSILLGTDGE